MRGGRSRSGKAHVAKTLNLGAGNRIIEGAINHDLTYHREEISIAHDLNCLPWPWNDNAFEQIQIISVAEHLKLTLIETLNECWRVLEPGGRLIIKYPHYNSSTSYDDPTHRWHWSEHVLDFVDPETRHGKDNHFYTPYKWRILERGIVHGRNVKAILEPMKNVS